MNKLKNDLNQYVAQANSTMTIEQSRPTHYRSEYSDNHRYSRSKHVFPGEEDHNVIVFLAAV